MDIDTQGLLPEQPRIYTGYEIMFYAAVIAATLLGFGSGFRVVTAGLVLSLLALVVVDARALNRERAACNSDEPWLAAPLPFVRWLVLSWLLGPIALPFYFAARRRRDGGASPWVPTVLALGWAAMVVVTCAKISD